MTSDTGKRRAMRVFDDALDVPALERAAFVAEACAGDGALRREVEELLAGDAEGDWLSEAVEAEIAAVAGDVVSKSPEDALLTVGEKLNGRYVVERRLGEGGFGAVFQARDEHLHGRRTAIKVLLETSARTAWTLGKFDQESEALTRIDHPNVVKVLDRGRLRERHPFLVMEFVEGQTLAEFLSTKTDFLDMQDTVSIVRQVCGALDAVHAQGVVHRDVKPSNIMLRRSSDGDLHAKLIDFGIAKLRRPASGDQTTTPLTVGTLPYMALELLEGREASPASDVYALGVIAHELLTGRRPFTARGSNQLAQIVEYRDAQKAGWKSELRRMRPDLPEAVESVVRRALSVRPEQRPQRAGDFGDEFAAVLSDLSNNEKQNGSRTAFTKIVMGGAATGTRGGSFARRMVLGVVGLVAALGLGTAAIGRLSPPPANPFPRPLSAIRPDVSPFTVLDAPDTVPAGREIRLRIALRRGGCFYVLSESPRPREDGLPDYTFLFPAPKDNRGSSWFAEQILSVPPVDEPTGLVFEGAAGTEKLWLVWSRESVPALEEVKPSANPREQGSVVGKRTSAVRDFLNRSSSRGGTELVVQCLKIEHR